MLYNLGESLKSKESVERALAITTKIGDRSGEASCYGNLGNVFNSLGQYDKAKEYYQKSLSSQLKLATENRRQLTTET